MIYGVLSGLFLFLELYTNYTGGQCKICCVTLLEAEKGIGGELEMLHPAPRTTDTMR